MRRRLFWTISTVAVVTGLLVLTGATVAAQRAAAEATRRELAKSSAEVLAVIDEATLASTRRPRALVEIFRLIEGDLGPSLGRIRRMAGGSDLAFATIAPDGSVRMNSDLFGRLDVDLAVLGDGDSVFTSPGRGEQVIVSATTIPVGNQEVTLVVALARESPVVRLSDMTRGLLIVATGMILLSAVLARVLSNQVAARLQPLSDASKSLASGDLTVRVPSLGDPDLDGLGESFNDMAAEIEATRGREREFLLGVGHDLRTPLTTIAGYAEALESGTFDSVEIGRIGSVLGTQSRQLGRLIEDLTLLARLEQPEFTVRLETVDVGAHVAEIVSGFQRNADAAGVRLTMTQSDTLPVETDPDRLGQIAQNLIENALRFTPEAGHVDVEVTDDSDGVMLAVVDTGVGIEPEDLPHVFDRHYVGRQRRVRNEGSGLGLSIVKGLAERLGGSAQAESAPGKGTTIRVRIPRSG